MGWNEYLWVVEYNHKHGYPSIYLAVEIFIVLTFLYAYWICFTEPVIGWVQMLLLSQWSAGCRCFYWASDAVLLNYTYFCYTTLYYCVQITPSWHVEIIYLSQIVRTITSCKISSNSTSSLPPSMCPVILSPHRVRILYPHRVRVLNANQFEQWWLGVRGLCLLLILSKESIHPVNQCSSCYQRLYLQEATKPMLITGVIRYSAPM